MDKLKALVAAKRKAADQEFGGKKFVKRSELEELRLRKLREEEEAERTAKEVKRQRHDNSLSAAQPSADANDTSKAHSIAGGSSNFEDKNLKISNPMPPKDQVVRRLRMLKQPVTLFGENDSDRYGRLIVAEQNIHVEDEAAGGQQANLHIEIAREQREKGKGNFALYGNAGGGGGGGGSKTDKKQQSTTADDFKNKTFAAAASSLAGQLLSTQDEKNNALAATTTATSANDNEQAQLMQAFQVAAEALAEKNLPVEEKIAKYLHKWMNEWEQDLENRSEEIKASPAGRQADIRFKETQQYFRPLFSRLKQRSLDEQLLAGIKLIVEAMQDRNYLHAYKIYMGVAIGNAPWPIGVTQVGLHERSAREKISFKYASGSAHIMNDEATRKFIQALKRLMTFCQRYYPTDPSRCVDFDGFMHDGRGAAGGGSDKQALLSALERGERITPAAAPSYIDNRGAVKIPEKWDQVLRGALKDVAASDAAEALEEEGEKEAGE